MKKITLLFVASLLMLLACSKVNEEKISVVPNPVEIVKSDLSKLRGTAAYDYEKFLSLTNYVHWYEGDIPKNGCAALATKGCAPAAYIMARRLVNKNFAVNVDEYKKAIDGMSTSCTTGTSFDKIGEYAKKTDQFGSKHYGMQTANREQFKTVLKGLLTNNYPTIAAVWVKGTSLVNTKVDAKGKPYGEGHVVTVYGLQQTKDGTNSIIYYLDPLSTASTGKKSIDYTTFLNSMLAVDGSVYYFQPIGILSK